MPPSIARLAAWMLLFLAILSMRYPPALAEDAGGLAVPVASSARVTGDAKTTRFEADLTYAIPFNVYVLADPYRVMIDLPAVDFRFGADAGKGRGLIRAFRYGRMGGDRARIVLDVDGPVLIRRSWVRHATADIPARMGVELIRTTPERFARLLAASDGGRKGATGNDKTVPRTDSDDGERRRIAAAFRHLVEEALRWRRGNETDAAPARTIADLLEDDPLPLKNEARDTGGGRVRNKEAKAPNQTADGGERRTRAAGGTTVSTPLSGRRVVVIDPGHGGKDPGAIGRRGVREKDLVLAFANQLATTLRKAGYDVLMTRQGDSFLTLRQRVEFARRHDAQLFISIHADKFRSGAAHGLAVYTLSEEASDAEAAALARSENAADVIDGVDLGADAEQVRDILIDLAMRETKNRSLHFARILTRTVRPVVRLRTRPVRSADFRVLRNPEVPAVLVELGYVSNPAEVRQMRSAVWRRRLAVAMTRAIDRYFAANRTAWRRTR